VRRLPASFFARDAVTVARALLGKRLRLGTSEGVIVETEAYAGDPASHAVTRPHTGRLLWTTHARVYVYRIYGVHLCLNVTADASAPGAVLLRAVEPTAGLRRMAARRGVPLADEGDARAWTRALRALCAGPGRLAEAFGVTMALQGTPVGRRLVVLDGPVPRAITATPRIGISAAQDLPWRFVVAESPYLSRGLPKPSLRP
jgi:DNA-3-methyladenine glycosylase